MKKALQLFGVLGAVALLVGVFTLHRLEARITTAASDDIWCVGPSGAEVCVDVSGNLISTTTNDADLGTSSLLWKALHLTAGGITDAAITTADLASHVVTTYKINYNAVTTGALAGEAVTTSKVAPGAITTPKIALDSITTNMLVTDAVATRHILLDAVTTGKIALASDMRTGAALCVTSSRKLGICKSAVDTTGGCGCD